MSKTIRLVLRYADGAEVETYADPQDLNTIVTRAGATFSICSFGDGTATYTEFVGRPYDVPVEGAPPRPRTMTSLLADKFNEVATKLEALQTVPKPYDLYYAVKKTEGWSYNVVGIGVFDLRNAADALAGIGDAPPVAFKKWDDK